MSGLATVFVNRNTPSATVRAAIDAIAEGKIKTEKAMNEFCVKHCFGPCCDKIATDMKLNKNQIALAQAAVRIYF